MKIYLAGSCSKNLRNIMENIAKEIRRDIPIAEVYCPFELKIENAWSYSQEEWSQKVFDKDVAAIDEADIVIMISTGRKSTAGTNWEQGYAYAKNKRIYVFQIVNSETSLMTYCGCDNFFRCNYSDVASIVKDIINGQYCEKNSCLTTLT